MTQQCIFSGLILSKQQYDRNGQLVLVFWLRSQNGVVRVEVKNEKAIVFCANNEASAFQQSLNREGIQFECKALSLTSLNHLAVTGFYFSSLKQFFSAKDLASSSGITLYEQDIKHCERYLMERFIKGQAYAIGHYEYRKGVHCLYDAKLSKSDERSLAPSELRILSLDIECSGLGVLYSIGFYNKDFKRVVMIGQGENEHWLEWVDDEIQLLQRLVAIVEDIDPDIFIGWNVIDFDFSLLCRRANELGVSLTLGRLGSQLRITQSAVNKISLPGRTVLDGIDMLKNASYHFSSYRLAQVSSELLGDTKLITTSNALAEIERQFKYEKRQLALYNINDCELVWRIFENKSLIEFAIARAELTGLDLNRLGGSVAAFTNLYLPHLHRAGYIAPNLGDAPVQFDSPGGYVMDSKPGLYKHVLVLDYKSLYPSIIRTFKIDPLGLIKGLEEKNSIDGFNGGKFSRQTHFVPSLIEQLWSAREKAKRDNNNTMSYAIKIIMNSFYGVLGSTSCRFYDPRLSSSVTMRGHEIMKKTRQLIENAGYEVIYGDTDSTFISIDTECNSNCSSIGQELTNQINNYWQSELQKSDLDSALEIEFETHYSPFFMPTLRGATTGSKKRYVGKDQNGNLIFKGLEAARGDWTVLAREFQIELFTLIFSDKSVSKFIIEQVELLKKGKFDDKLIYRKRLGQNLEMYQRNVPPHVKAVLEFQLVDPTFILRRGDWVDYIMTTKGPLFLPHQRLEKSIKLDYEHYIEKQLKPIVEAVESQLGLNFEQLIDDQKRLF